MADSNETIGKSIGWDSVTVRYNINGTISNGIRPEEPHHVPNGITKGHSKVNGKPVLQRSRQAAADTSVFNLVISWLCLFLKSMLSVCSFRRRHHRKKTCLVVALGSFCILFVTLKWKENSIYMVSSPPSISNNDINPAGVLPLRPIINQTTEAKIKSPDRCMTYDLAMVVWSPAEAREAGFMLKTLFFHRTSALHLHVIVTDDLTEKIMTTLMNTWELTLVTFDIYRGPTAYKQPHWRFLKYELWSVLPQSIDKVLYIGNRMRFIGDVGELWGSIEEGFKPEQLVGLESTSPHCSDEKADCFGDDEAIFEDLSRFQKSAIKPDLLAATTPLDVYKILMKHPNVLSPLPCEWTVRLISDTVTDPVYTCNTTAIIKGLIWKNLGDSSSNAPLIEKYREHVLSIVGSEPIAYEPLNCRGTIDALKSGASEIKYTDSCDKFRYIAHMKKRTHLFYMGDTPQGIASTGDNDVSLMTMLTVDRLNVLERMMSAWKGPASVVFYATDNEAITLERLIRDSSVLSKRKRISYHVVYRRQKYNPINYLRNVAINNSATPYLAFVDVDLIPNPDLYDSLKTKLRKKIDKKDNTTIFVIPAFQSFSTLETNMPKKKSELLEFIKKETIVGYRMKASWNLGHRPTNFTYWVIAKEPYKAIFQDAFEPYVVTPANIPTRFNEDLLERMGDKIAYGRILHAYGYNFMVLNDDFIIHIPHPMSQGTKQYHHEPNLGRCGSVFFEKFRKELYTKFPNVKF